MNNLCCACLCCVLYSVVIIFCFQIALHTISYLSDSPKTSKVLAFSLFLTASARVLLDACLSEGHDRAPCVIVLIWTLIQLLPTQPPSTSLWLIRKVSGITSSATQGRRWKYLQSSQDGISLGGAWWWVASSLFMPPQSGEYFETWPRMSSHVVPIKCDNVSDYADVRPKISCSFTYTENQST